MMSDDDDNKTDDDDVDGHNDYGFAAFPSSQAAVLHASCRVFSHPLSPLRVRPVEESRLPKEPP